MTKREKEMIDKRGGSAVERMNNGLIAKRVHVGKCTGSESIGCSRKRWTNILKDCLKNEVIKQGEWRMIGGTGEDL